MRNKQSELLEKLKELEAFCKERGMEDELKVASHIRLIAELEASNCDSDQLTFLRQHALRGSKWFFPQ